MKITGKVLEFGTTGLKIFVSDDQGKDAEKLKNAKRITYINGYEIK